MCRIMFSREDRNYTHNPKLAVGDVVIYTNPQGVVWGEHTIKAIDTDAHKWSKEPRYYIEPTETPWYSVAESCLTKVEK